MLEDRRISPALRKGMWGASDDVDFSLEKYDPLSAEFKRRPSLHARVRLVAPSGQATEERKLEEVLAQLEAAPLHGTSSPIVYLEENTASGMGSYSGITTTLLQPRERGLKPVDYVATATGKTGVIGIGIEVAPISWTVCGLGSYVSAFADCMAAS